MQQSPYSHISRPIVWISSIDMEINHYLKVHLNLKVGTDEILASLDVCME